MYIYMHAMCFSYSNCYISIVYCLSPSQLISSIACKLVPDSCNIIAVSPKFAGECSQQEKWFGTMYSRQGNS